MFFAWTLDLQLRDPELEAQRPRGGGDSAAGVMVMGHGAWRMAVNGGRTKAPPLPLAHCSGCVTCCVLYSPVHALRIVHSALLVYALCGVIRT